MNTYLVVKALHIIAFTSWMAGMFYLPRLFAYHAGTAPGSESSELLKTMERRLLRIIINPAMVLTFGFGVWLISIVHPERDGWFHFKALLLVAMFALHGFFSKTRRRFAADERPRSSRFYKIINELVTLIFVVIVLLAVTKPF
jgi:putative membrane protein